MVLSGGGAGHLTTFLAFGVFVRVVMQLWFTTTVHAVTIWLVRAVQILFVKSVTTLSLHQLTEEISLTLLVPLSEKSIEKFGLMNFKSTNNVVNGTPTTLRSVAAHYHWRYAIRSND
jgi:hypothetical protein